MESSSAAASLLFDATLDAAQSLGLISEAERDGITDEIACGETTECAVAEEWAALVTAEQRVVNGKAANKYAYRLVRASERARGPNGAELSDGEHGTVGWQASRAMATTSDEREGAYRGVPGMDEGFIHLSAANQVRKTAALYFQGVEDLLLLKFDKERLDQSGISLRYEEAAPPAGTQARRARPRACPRAPAHHRCSGHHTPKHGAMHSTASSQPRAGAFPHAYAGGRPDLSLDYSTLADVVPLTLNVEGSHVFPPRAFEDPDA